MATKKTKSIKNAPALRNEETYKNSAGVKLPNADIIIEADEDGTVTSCRDAVTGTEYVGGGGGVNVENKIVSIKNTDNSSTKIIIARINSENDAIVATNTQFAANGTLNLSIVFYNGKAFIETSQFHYLRGNDVELGDDGYSTGYITGNSPIEIYYED